MIIIIFLGKGTGSMRPARVARTLSGQLPPLVLPQGGGPLSGVFLRRLPGQPEQFPLRGRVFQRLRPADALRDLRPAQGGGPLSRKLSPLEL